MYITMARVLNLTANLHNPPADHPRGDSIKPVPAFLFPNNYFATIYRSAHYYI